MTMLGKVALVFILFFVTVYWLIHTEDLSIYFKYQVPAGQIFYLFSKLVGMIAFVLICFQLSITMKPSLFVKEYSHKIHKRFGLLVFVFVVLHLALFAFAVYLRQGHFPKALFVPSFSSGFYKLMLSSGVVAFYSLLVAISVRFLRVKKFVKLHGLVWLVFVLSFIHALNIGSEFQTKYLMAMYVVMFLGVSVFFLMKKFKAKNYHE